jgi:hypothetical protein
VAPKERHTRKVTLAENFVRFVRKTEKPPSREKKGSIESNKSKAAQ